MIEQKRKREAGKGTEGRNKDEENMKEMSGMEWEKGRRGEMEKKEDEGI